MPTEGTDSRSPQCTQCEQPIDLAHSSVSALNAGQLLCTKCYLAQGGTWSKIGAGAAACPITGCTRFMSRRSRACSVCRHEKRTSLNVCPRCKATKSRTAQMCMDCSWEKRRKGMSQSALDATCATCSGPKSRSARGDQCWECRTTVSQMPDHLVEVHTAVDALINSAEQGRMPDLADEVLRAARKLRAAMDLFAAPMPSTYYDPFEDMPTSMGQEKKDKGDEEEDEDADPFKTPESFPEEAPF